MLGTNIIVLISCVRNELHVIVDELYMLTVFDESVTFQSVLSADRYSRTLALHQNSCG